MSSSNVATGVSNDWAMMTPMTFWTVVGLVLQVTGLAVAGWALERELRSAGVRGEIPERPRIRNPWEFPIEGERPLVGSGQRAWWWNKMSGSSSYGYGRRGGGGISPDQAAFESEMADIEEQRRQRLAQTWEIQERAMGDLFDATASIVRAMVDGHERAVRRIRVEAIGLAFALLGTVISTLAG